MLEVIGLTRTYGSHQAIKDVSLQVADGELVTIVGPSGCGKSTLLRCIAGLLPPTAGRVVLNGTPVTQVPDRLGVVFQDYSRSLYPWLNVADNVALPLRRTKRRRAARREAALTALESVGLAGFEGRYPWQLSGGMQQRVAIARALAYNPSVLLMDEPFAALDALTRDDMQRLLADVWRETRKTVIYVTHNVAEAVYLADRVIIMTPHPGTVKAQVPVRLERPRDPLSVAFLDHQKQLLRHLGAVAATSP